MKLKLDGNLLSLVHNCAAAEAMVLGMAGELFGYVDLARRVPTDHPLRVIRAGVNAALGELSVALASSMRVWAGRRSRPRSCWASCCCRRSIRSARSAS
jgi:hypothetical protein